MSCPPHETKNFIFDRRCVLIIRKLYHRRTSQSAGAGIRASIFNRCNDATVRIREVSLVDAPCDVITLPHMCNRFTQKMIGRRVIGISGSLVWSKTLMELTFNPCGEFR